MKRVSQFFCRTLSSDASDRRWGQYFFYMTAPVLLVLSMRWVAEVSTTSSELMIGTFAALGLALLFVITGYCCGNRRSTVNAD